MVQGLLVGLDSMENSYRLLTQWELSSKDIGPKSYIGHPTEVMDYGPKSKKIRNWAYIGQEENYKWALEVSNEPEI